MKSVRSVLLRTESLLAMLLIVVIVLMASLSGGKFLGPRSLQSMGFQLPEFGILALAQMIIIITGGINLSITYSATLSAVIGSVVIAGLNAAHQSPALAILAGIVVMFVVGAACGAFNGSIVAYVGVSPILVTLGSMTLFEGISLQITRGGAVTGFPVAFLWIGNGTILNIPVPLFLFVIVAAVTYFVLERTSYGMRLYMIGANPTATVYSGVNVKRILFLLYIYSALLCALAGVIMTSRYNSAKESYGSSYLLQSVAASVLGGTDIVGGAGKVLGTVLAVLILQGVSSGLDIVGLNRFITNVIMGGILIAVLSVNYLNTSAGSKTRLRRRQTSEVLR
ncbi:MAG TPA: ABC transporter permease [Spirochaetia bacterium]|nr:ABC transporter permease [Spirochaetia bacterium]